jgi:hypothetical protein
MLATFIGGSVIPLVASVIPLVAIVCGCGVAALKILCRYPPARPDFSTEDRAKIGRITEMVDKMESRVTALETLLKEEQTNKAASHEQNT